MFTEHLKYEEFVKQFFFVCVMVVVCSIYGKCEYVQVHVSMHLSAGHMRYPTLSASVLFS